MIEWIDAKHALAQVRHADEWLKLWINDLSVASYAAERGELPNTVTKRLQRARREVANAIGT